MCMYSHSYTFSKPSDKALISISDVGILFSSLAFSLDPFPARNGIVVVHPLMIMVCF